MTDCIVTTTKKGRNRPDTTLNGKRIRSHKAAWIRVNGPIPEGLCVCHKCDNPQCINPDHLFLGTHKDNMQDMWAKGRANPRKFEIGADHPRPMAKLTEETAVYAMARLLSGERQKSVAASFGVDQSCISCLWSGRTWSHCFQDGGQL